jgi:uncharacterized protein YigA (DUF484 family)
MTPDAVATYLKEHPEFFEQHADMVADMHIPHPHGGRAIPLSERQILTLRDRGRQLETKLREVIQFGQENDAIGEKVHRLAVVLITARRLDVLVGGLGFNLREDFAVPHVALRAWRSDGEAFALQVPTASAATREHAALLGTAYCGAAVPPETVPELFGDAAPHLKSFSYIPLRNDTTFGLLAFASEDAQRFYPDMGTVYLKRIGEMVAAALMRHFDDGAKGEAVKDDS